MKRVYNFSAGPAVLPEEVLREAADEMLDYKGCGMSVMEMSHRSKAFAEIIETAEQDLRDLMGIPDNYKVLFLQGGASQQFAMIPMNLMKNRVADYIRIKPFRTFLTVRICRLMKMQIMYISAKIIQFTEPNLRNFRTRKARHW